MQTSSTSKISTGQSNPSTNTTQNADHSKTFAAVWLPIFLAIGGSLGGAGAWVYQERKATEKENRDIIQKEIDRKNQSLQAVKIENERLKREYLEKIQTSLEDNRIISKELQDYYAEPGWGILESYVAKVRRDGAIKHAPMQARIARLVRTNEAILTLMEGYQPYILTPQLKKEAAAFRDHAFRYIDRWDSVPSVISSGTQLRTAMVFPKDLNAAMANEIKAREDFQAK